MRRRRRQAAEARESRVVHPRVLRSALRQRVQLRADLRRASRGARASASELLQSCRRTRARSGITLFATAFDFESADLLAELDVPAFKFASGDLRNTPLQRHVAAFGKPMFLSTGGGTLEDVERAVETIVPINPQLCVLQCTAAYPAAARGSQPERDHDAARAVPGARDRPLRPPERDRDGGRRLHARRARDREALHARPRAEGHATTPSR